MQKKKSPLCHKTGCQQFHGSLGRGLCKGNIKRVFFFTTKQTGLDCLPGGEGLCREDGLEVLGANAGFHELLEADQLATGLLVVLVEVVPTKPRFSFE